MSVAQKAYLFAAGLFLVMAFTSVAVIIFGQAQDGAKSAQQEFVIITSELKATTFGAFDNGSFTGSIVVNTINKYSKKEGFGVYVRTGKNIANGSTGKWYNDYVVTTGGPSNKDYGTVVKGGGSGLIENAKNEYHDDYVNPNGDFRSNLIYDKNRQVVGIEFIQK